MEKTASQRSFFCLVEDRTVCKNSAFAAYDLANSRVQNGKVLFLPFPLM